MNFQNLPRSDKTIHRAFIPKLDALLFFDFMQIEYRLLSFYIASTLGDHSMAQVFIDGHDLHTETAGAILGKNLDDVTDEDRQMGKVWNFLTVYGGGPGKAASSLGIPMKVAQEQQTLFHRRWPGVKLLHNPPFRNGGYKQGEGPGRIQERLDERGYLTTLWGRHLHPEAPHKALNALVQGCAADLMRAALVKVHEELRGYGLESHIVNVVHDELILDATFDEIPLLRERVPILMDHPAVSEIVPVEVDMEISVTNWAEKIPYTEEVLDAGRPRASRPLAS